MSNVVWSAEHGWHDGPEVAVRLGSAGRLVHLHATVSDRAYCDTVCGLHCGEVDTAYRGRDPERVTCPDCQGRAS